MFTSNVSYENSEQNSKIHKNLSSYIQIRICFKIRINFKIQICFKKQVCFKIRIVMLHKNHKNPILLQNPNLLKNPNLLQNPDKLQIPNPDSLNPKHYKLGNKSGSTISNTLFEILIFCPKIQLWFREKIVDFFLGEKLVKMLWFWTF